MKVAIKDHGGAAAPLAEALLQEGCEFPTDGTAEVLLIDFDIPKFGYRDLIDHYSDQGTIVLQYPHGATANLGYDALYEPYERVDGQLTTSNGEIEYLRRLGIERPARAIGWSYCQQFPFRSRSEVKKVVFAPTHPNGDGSMLAERLALNGEMFRRVLAGPWETTVRYIGSFEQNGIWEETGVRYYPGAMDMSTAEIDGTDCVVAGTGTYPALAIARGVPTVMYGQGQAAVWGEAGDVAVPLRNPSLYEDVTRYPIDAEDDTLENQVRLAATDDALIAQWRQDWIGEQLVPAHALGVIESFVAELKCTIPS